MFNFKTVMDATVNFVKDIPAKVKAMPKEAKIAIGAGALVGAGLGVYKTVAGKKGTVVEVVDDEAEVTEGVEE